MAEEGKKLVQLTGVAKRLASEFASYVKVCQFKCCYHDTLNLFQETGQLEQKLQQVQASPEADASDIKKHREFLEESHAALRTVQPRLQEAYENLKAHMQNVAEGPELEAAKVQIERCEQLFAQMSQ